MHLPVFETTLPGKVGFQDVWSISTFDALFQLHSSGIDSAITYCAMGCCCVYTIVQDARGIYTAWSPSLFAEADAGFSLGFHLSSLFPGSIATKWFWKYIQFKGFTVFLPPTSSPQSSASPPSPKAPSASAVKVPTKTLSHLPTKQPSQSNIKANQITLSLDQQFRCQRNWILHLFNTAIAFPKEMFANVAAADPMILHFTTIGQATIGSGGIIVHGACWRYAIFYSSYCSWFFATKFWTDAPFTIRADLNGDPVTTFVKPTSTPSVGAPLAANVVYIGLVHLGGMISLSSLCFVTFCTGTWNWRPSLFKRHFRECVRFLRSISVIES
jgi:hypothetical protein